MRSNIPRRRRSHPLQPISSSSKTPLSDTPSMLSHRFDGDVLPTSLSNHSSTSSPSYGSLSNPTPPQSPESLSDSLCSTRSPSDSNSDSDSDFYFMSNVEQSRQQNLHHSDPQFLRTLKLEKLLLLNGNQRYPNSIRKHRPLSQCADTCDDHVDDFGGVPVDQELQELNERITRVLGRCQSLSASFSRQTGNSVSIPSAETITTISNAETLSDQQQQRRFCITDHHFSNLSKEAISKLDVDMLTPSKFGIENKRVGVGLQHTSQIERIDRERNSEVEMILQSDPKLILQKLRKRYGISNEPVDDESNKCVDNENVMEISARILRTKSYGEADELRTERWKFGFDWREDDDSKIDDKNGNINVKTDFRDYLNQDIGHQFGAGVDNSCVSNCEANAAEVDTTVSLPNLEAGLQKKKDTIEGFKSSDHKEAILNSTDGDSLKTEAEDKLVKSRVAEIVEQVIKEKLFPLSSILSPQVSPSPHSSMPSSHVCGITHPMEPRLEFSASPGQNESNSTISLAKRKNPSKALMPKTGRKTPRNVAQTAQHANKPATPGNVEYLITQTERNSDEPKLMLEELDAPVPSHIDHEYGLSFKGKGNTRQECPAENLELGIDKIMSMRYENNHGCADREEPVNSESTTKASSRFLRKQSVMDQTCSATSEARDVTRQKRLLESLKMINSGNIELWMREVKCQENCSSGNNEMVGSGAMKTPKEKDEVLDMLMKTLEGLVIELRDVESQIKLLESTA